MTVTTFVVVGTCCAILLSFGAVLVTIWFSWQQADLDYRVVRLEQARGVRPAPEPEDDDDEELIEGMEWREFIGAGGEIRRLRIRSTI